LHHMRKVGFYFRTGFIARPSGRSPEQFTMLCLACNADV
jgi:hypothetical protein